MSLFVGLPSLDGGRVNALALAEIAARRPGAVFVERMGCFIAANRNDIWCDALNAVPRPDRLLWLDADVLPDPLEGFLGLLEREMERVGASILGVPVAMKTRRQDTSTAIDGDPVRRLSLQELLCKPTTWTHPGLLLATGLVLVDFTGDWVENVSFSTNDGIRKGADGAFRTVNESEDYRWCRDARALGASVWTTRVVGTAHVGLRDHRIPAAA